MKNLITILILFVSLTCWGGQTILADGKTVVYWDDQTVPVAYNGYRVEIKMTDSYQKNVWGTVSLIANNKRVATKNFMISAGERNCYVDFDNLFDGTTYLIKVDVKGK